MSSPLQMKSKQQVQHSDPSPQPTSLELFDSKSSLLGVQSIPLDRLFLADRQSRRYFDEEAIEQLTVSIKKNGILQPLLVRPIRDKYEVVAGERRYRAAKIAGLKELPVNVREMTADQALQYALVENLQRKDLNPIDETEGILQLLAIKLNCSSDEVKSMLYRMKNERGKKNRQQTVVDASGSMTLTPDAIGEEVLPTRESDFLRENVFPNDQFEKVKEVFASIGKMSWESFIVTRLRLLNLPDEILEVLRQGRIEYTKAKAISKLKFKSERKVLLEEAIAESLSLNQIKKRVKALQETTEQNKQEYKILDDIRKQTKKLKVWSDPDKRTILEALLTEIEILLSKEE